MTSSSGGAGPPKELPVVDARFLSHSRQLAGQLQEAIQERAVIDQAVGILRSRSGGTAQQALDALRELSRTERAPLLDTADKVVGAAVAAARARRIRD